MKSLFYTVRKGALLGLFGLSLTSCEFLLDEVPPDALAQDVVFTNPDLARQAVIAVYDGMQAPAGYGSRLQLYTDILGGDLENRTQNGTTGYGTFIASYTAAAGDPAGQWGSLYDAVNAANIVITGLPTSPLDPAEISAGLGEAYFVRAVSYLALVNQFGESWYESATAGSTPGVILRLEENLSAENEDVPRSSVQAVYDQILADLAEAESRLPAATAGTFGSTAFATQEACIAMRMRTYWCQENYAGVITEGAKLAPQATAPFSSSAGHALVAGGSYSTIFTTYTTVENIFSVQHTSQDRPNTQQNLPGFYRLGVGDYQVADGAGRGVNLYPSGDNRRSVIQFNAGTSSWFLRKYTDDISFADWAPVIRYSDVLLMYAEALLRSDASDAKGVALLNAVRSRAGIGTLAGPIALDSIYVERRREFIGEGFATWELRRRNQNLPDRVDFAGTPEAAITPTTPTYRFPIPQTEVDRNSAAVQNTGY